MQVLGTYKPLVWEYSRLNITHNVMSKRKLNSLVTDKYVHGWDDPRLLTLAGLRRRGVTPEVQSSAGRRVMRSVACPFSFLHSFHFVPYLRSCCPSCVPCVPSPLCFTTLLSFTT